MMNKPLMHCVLPKARYKSFNSAVALLLTILYFLFPASAGAQCPTGYNQVTLNWDFLDYFAYINNYTSAKGYLSSNSLAQTQNFAFGTQRVTITHNYSAGAELGEDSLHTGDAGSYAIGTPDIHFNGNGTVTFTFENEVQNLKFSIYDLDLSQTATVTAVDAASVSLPVVLSKAVPLSASVNVNPIPVTGPTATSTATNIATTANTNTINVDVTGPVKAVTVTTNGVAGDYWLSNIIACSAGSFPTNYYSVSKPFTGQPGYVLHAFDNDVYAINPATGVTKYIFSDNSNPYGGSGFVNSMGYDPVKRILYYVYSLTNSPGTNVMLRKYDFNTQTQSTVLADITTIGIPVVTSTNGFTARGTGLESGAGAFYNGSFFLGVETNNKSASNILGTSYREAVVWRIDFNASNVPYRSSQVFALPIDSAGTLKHDWSDFSIKDGVLYDFDGAGTTTETDIYQFDMITSATVNYNLPAFTPGQPAVDWNGNIYQLYATTATTPTVSPYIAPYNPATGTIGTKLGITSVPAYTPAIPSLGDAAEGYRPLVDYGDAPATYDPTAGDPAVHEIDTALHLGAATGTHIDVEWLTRGQTTAANSDNYDDGLGAAPPLLNFNGTVSYSVPNITVYNNTGSAATLIGWLDYNMNGVFDVGEGRAAASIPSSTTAQTVALTWTSIFVPNTAATGTYLRLRLTKAASGMTTSNMTGFMPDGEVEDYRVVLGVNLPLVITSFDAQKGNGKTANLQWTTTGNENEVSGFDIERSSNGQQWTTIGTTPVSGALGTDGQYAFKDANALAGKSFYRLKIIAKNGIYKYTEIKTISFSYLKGKISVSPNPVTDYITVQLSSEHASSLAIQLFDYSGKILYSKHMAVVAGDNSIRLNDIKGLVSGMYYIKLSVADEVFTDKLIVVKN